MDRRGAGDVTEENVRVSRATAEAVQRLNLAPVPTIALVQGACFGGGTGLVAACDVVIAADNAMFSIAEVRWGLTAAIIIPQLNDAIGVRQMRRYALTGERFDAGRRAASGSCMRWSRGGAEAAGERIVGMCWKTARRRSRRPRRSHSAAFGDLDERLSPADRKPRRQAAVDRGGGRPGIVRGKARGEVRRRRVRTYTQSAMSALPPIEDNLLHAYSMTSSARASSVGGTSRPSALAVVRLMTRSNLVGCSTGMSAGFAPRKILSTKSAARRNRCGKFGP